MISIFFATFLLQATYIDLFNEGHQLLDEGRYKEAEKVLVESVSANPSYIPALRELAKAYVKLKRFPEAIDQYRRIVEINPKDMTAWAQLAELYSWVGNHDKSIVTYKDALERDPANPVLKTGLAKVLRWSHRYDEAKRLYNEVLSTDVENHEALKGLAETHSMTGDLTAAIEVFEKAIKLYPEDPELRKEKGTVLAWQKDYTNALTELEKAVELSPNYAEAYRTMGDVYLWMKSYGHAERSYKKATDIEPANVENYLLLARVYRQAGDDHMAEESVKTALKFDPSNARALDLLRELRGTVDIDYGKRLGDTLELVVFLFVFVLLLVVYRSKRRMLLRRHKLYVYFINFILPSLVLITFASFLGRDSLTTWVDIGVIEDITEAVLFLALGTSLLAILWSEHRGRDFSKMVIIAIGAHPDDIELGCGGFIMKAKDSGAKVYGITMTRGEKGTDKSGRREEEFGKAAKYMELDGFWTYDFPDTELDTVISGMKDVLEEKIKEVGASVVFTHTDMDIHSDHRAVFEATKVAARHISILCYEDVSTPSEFVPNYFVDVTGYIEDKLRLIAFHKTQGGKTYMDPEVIKGRAAHRGLQSNVQYAEAFKINKLVR